MSKRIFPIILMVCLVVLVFLFVFYNDFTATHKTILYIVACITALLGAATVVSYTENTFEENNLKTIRQERTEIKGKIEKNAPEPDVLHTIQLNLNQLTEYYTINKGQAKRSFWYSIGAITVGLLTIIMGIVFYYFNVKQIEIVYITGVCGVLLEFIGGAHFFMYKKSLEQFNIFFGQLVKTQDTMLAVNLAKNMEQNKRLEMEGKIIESLLERSLK